MTHGDAWRSLSLHPTKLLLSFLSFAGVCTIVPKLSNDPPEVWDEMLGAAAPIMQFHTVSF